MEKLSIKELNKAQMLSLFMMYLNEKKQTYSDGLSITDIWKVFNFNAPHICNAFLVLRQKGFIAISPVRSGRLKKYFITKEGIDFIEQEFERIRSV